MAYHVFIDNSNLWIEGQYASAVAQGWAADMDEAHERSLNDLNWRIDYGKLLYFIVEGNLDEIKTAMLFGSVPPENDSLWAMIEAHGIEVKVLKRNFANKEKAVDTEMVHRIDKCIYKNSQEGDIFVLVTGDRDFRVVIEPLKEEKRHLHLAFWSNAAWELKTSADKFIDLTENIKSITYLK